MIRLDLEAQQIALDGPEGEQRHALASPEAFAILTEAYAPLVRPGGSIVVADGVMPALTGLPGAGADWSWNNPLSAIAAFLDQHPEFERMAPPCPFNEGGVPSGGSYWPGGYLRRIG